MFIMRFISLFFFSIIKYSYFNSYSFNMYIIFYATRTISNNNLNRGISISNTSFKSKRTTIGINTTIIRRVFFLHYPLKSVFSIQYCNCCSNWLLPLLHHFIHRKTICTILFCFFLCLFLFLYNIVVVVLLAFFIFFF